MAFQPPTVPSQERTQALRCGDWFPGTRLSGTLRQMGNDWGKLCFGWRKISPPFWNGGKPPTPIVLLGKCIGSWDVCCFLGQGAVKKQQENNCTALRVTKLSIGASKNKECTWTFSEEVAIYGIRTDMTDYPITNNEDVKCNFKK